MMGILRDVWSEVLPSTNPPQLFYRLSAERAEEYLTNLGIADFEIRWRRRVMRIGEAVVERYLDFFRLVGHFWQWSLDTETADLIEALVVKAVMARVTSNGYFVNTVSKFGDEISISRYVRDQGVEIDYKVLHSEKQLTLF